MWFGSMLDFRFQSDLILICCSAFVALNSQDYNAKLSDFGLARDGPVGNQSHVSSRVMGTEGYAAPEYIATGTLSICLFCQILRFPLITENPQITLYIPSIFRKDNCVIFS